MCPACLRGDIRQHFPSTDHAGLRKLIPEGDIITLIETILARGRDVRDEYSMVWFPGDNLLAACCPRGLPIGSLTAVLVLARTDYRIGSPHGRTSFMGVSTSSTQTHHGAP
jgi:hypothetical protein